MRTWGPAPFQNSAAMDWLGGLASGLQLPDLAVALQHASSANETERATARAAVALVAAALGNPEDNLPETAKRWLTLQDISHAEQFRDQAFQAARAFKDTELIDALAVQSS